MNRYNSNTNSSEFNDRDDDDRDSYRHRRSSPSSFRVSVGGGGGGGHRPFDSPPRQHLGGGGGFRSIGGGELRPMGGGFGGSYPAPPMPPLLQQSQPQPQPQSHAGQKRGFPFSGQGDSPSTDRLGGGSGGGSFAKLFVGSVPRTIREEDIRPLFEEHGNVLEVALIKDKRTGQQQGCCFIKYSTTEEAERAIRALHNRHTLPGGVGPIQVRYADGERERLGAVEYKLFVGSLNKQATEKEVEEVFSSFGRVEDVYLMRDELKQSRGCGFVKYADREMALAAIDALNGIYPMRGCDQPLTVRFADPKRPRSGAGDSRGGAPAFGGPGFGPHFQVPVPRQTPNFPDTRGDHVTSNAWHPMSPENIGPPSNPGIRGFGSQLPPRSGDLTMPSNPGGPFGGPSEGVAPGVLGPSSSTSQQGFNQSSSQVPLVGQQISPLQKPLQSPQHLPPSFQLQSQRAASYPQTLTAHHGQPQFPTASQTPFSQAQPSQHLHGLSGQLPSSQVQVQQSVSSSTPSQTPLIMNFPPGNMSTSTNQQHLPPPIQQSPSQLAQMLSQQTQTLQATFQSSQQAFSQLQQQLQQMQPSNPNSSLQQNPQKHQSQWLGISPQPVASTPTTIPAKDVPSSTASGHAAPAVKQPVAPLECHWTEHTSPDGFKYYHNSVTRESRWEKPEELILFEQQKQQQKQVQQPTQPHPQVLPTQQASQAQQAQPHTQLQIQQRQQQQQQQLQQPFFPSMYPASGIRGQQNTQEIGYTQLSMPTPTMNDPTRFQQGLLPAQELAWKNKPSGT
ncbi:hypothetical protein SLEP1_g45871 [Rubroshorea leprosula]|uniref:Flowering time control protein FCA n=1 Tax=Rubroshorea leprosula TaxID=152421 RepID=A0AAV5LLA7_9ROSI|nr:hypothetical protein SLEP1_g45871 [Rubroshorea leprosula]